MILKIFAYRTLINNLTIKKFIKLILYIIIDGMPALQISIEIVPDLAMARNDSDNIFLPTHLQV